MHASWSMHGAGSIGAFVEQPTNTSNFTVTSRGAEFIWTFQSNMGFRYLLFRILLFRYFGSNVYVRCQNVHGLQTSDIIYNELKAKNKVSLFPLSKFSSTSMMQTHHLSDSIKMSYTIMKRALMLWKIVEELDEKNGNFCRHAWDLIMSFILTFMSQTSAS